MNLCLTGPPFAWRVRIYEVTLKADRFTSIWPADWINGESTETKPSATAPTHAILHLWDLNHLANVGSHLILKTAGDEAAPFLDLVVPPPGTGSARSTQEHAAFGVPLAVGQPLAVRFMNGSTKLKILAQYGWLDEWTKALVDALWRVSGGK